MSEKRTSGVSRLIRRLRSEAGLTQQQLADRVETTQSVVSRLESDDYEGHSLSMLLRIGAALNREIVVTADPGRDRARAVAEKTVRYEAGPSCRIGARGLSSDELDMLVTILSEAFDERGVTRAEIDAAVARARRPSWARLRGPSVDTLRGSIRVGPGDVVADVREARSRRGRVTER